MERVEPKIREQPTDVPRLQLFGRPSDNATTNEGSRKIKFELFFDLWFVANIQILAENKEISQPKDLQLYIGFLCILWFTWFSVCMFDVRFMTDSIFERVIRVVQFASMAGFTLVISKFDPRQTSFDPKKTGDSRLNTSQKLSLILMIVRLSLVAQYCSNFKIPHPERRNKQPPPNDKPDARPILIAAAVHFVASIVYLGITFRFDNDHNSKVYIVWYIVSGVEAILQVALAWRFDVLTFKSTKLTERLAVFTVVVLGEGVSAITKAILLVVENGDNWTPRTVGVFISAVATTYFIFLIYFDWMDHEELEDWQQLVYALLHFIFHGALLLFGAGTALFMKLGHATIILQEMKAQVQKGLNDTLTEIPKWSESDVEAHNVSNRSEAVADRLWNIVLEANAQYPIQSSDTNKTITEALDKIRLKPDQFWTSGNGTNAKALGADDAWNTFYLDMSTSISKTFEVASFDPGDSESGAQVGQDSTEAPSENTVVGNLQLRVGTTFRYMFVSAAVVILLMTFFHVLITLQKQKRWGAFDYVRIGLYASIGLGLGLMPLISLNEEAEYNYYVSPWVLPTISLAVFSVLLFTHVHRPSRNLHKSTNLRTENTAYSSLSNPPNPKEDTAYEGRQNGPCNPPSYIPLQSIESSGGR
ncbi:hypothetical protein PG985_014634 [Apiospora marii]|uniref:uncharacterized protein n=1 Tax=Apiospora marii TaxID=335849 RepID=UPI00312CCCAF